jgi:hypothetical protein
MYYSNKYDIPQRAAGGGICAMLKIPWIKIAG